MGRGLSLWMDALRVLATLVVVLSHVAYPRFTENLGWVRELNIGADAVIVFFVISGLVIAYAARRDAEPGVYAFNRLTRLWSVLIPAIILTFVMDRTGVAIDAEAYPAPFYQPMGLVEMLARGATFSNEWIWGHARLGTNGPLWSLSYEAGYYILFAAAVFLQGARRWIMLALLAVLIGPRVLLLMPAWLMGVGVYYAVLADWPARLSRHAALVLALGGPLFYGYGQWADMPGQLIGSPGLMFSQNWIWNGFIGLCTAMHLLGMARLLSGITWRGAALRWAAGASFSVYVIHYPVLHLLDASLPLFSGRGWVLGVGSIAAGLVFAQLCERRLHWVRAVARSWLHKPAATHSSA